MTETEHLNLLLQEALEIIKIHDEQIVAVMSWYAELEERIHQLEYPREDL